MNHDGVDKQFRELMNRSVAFEDNTEDNGTLSQAVLVHMEGLGLKRDDVIEVKLVVIS